MTKESARHTLKTTTCLGRVSMKRDIKSSASLPNIVPL
jgi:hypothetical protein